MEPATFFSAIWWLVKVVVAIYVINLLEDIRNAVVNGKTSGT